MSVNKAILLGYVSNEPEIRYPQQDKPIARLTLVTKETSFTGNDSSEWHRLVFFGETAKIVERYVRKGTQLYVEGKISTREFDDKFKIHRFITEIIVSFFEIVGRRPE